jgi:hypothetical protein
MIKKVAAIIFLFFLFIGGTFGQTQNEEKELLEYQKMQERVRALSDSRNLFGLVHLSDVIISVWGKKSPKFYAGLMYEVCGAMGSYDFDNDERYVLARKCTKRALAQTEQIPIYWELKLASLLNGDIEYLLKLVPPENWAQDRTERLKYWCRAWQKLEREIDENFDFEANRPVYRSNMTKEERQKAEKYNQQRFLQRDKKTFSSQFQNFLIEAYTKPPHNLPELKEYLKKYIADESLKSTVLSEVENRISENDN